MHSSRPCRFCRRWFYPHPRLGDRQYACSEPECQEARQRGNVAAWWARHPAYRVEHAIRLRELRAAQQQVVDPLEVPHPLAALWGGTAARAPFLRAAAAALLSASGFDVAPAAEAGLHVERARLIAYLSAGAARWLAGPRLNLEVRAGFGVRF